MEELGDYWKAEGNCRPLEQVFFLAHGLPGLDLPICLTLSLPFLPVTVSTVVSWFLSHNRLFPRETQSVLSDGAGASPASHPTGLQTVVLRLGVASLCNTDQKSLLSHVSVKQNS